MNFFWGDPWVKYLNPTILEMTNIPRDNSEAMAERSTLTRIDQSYVQDWYHALVQ